MLSIEQISARVENSRERDAERDSRLQDVLDVRKVRLLLSIQTFSPKA